MIAGQQARRAARAVVGAGSGGPPAVGRRMARCASRDGAARLGTAPPRPGGDGARLRGGPDRGGSCRSASASSSPPTCRDRSPRWPTAYLLRERPTLLYLSGPPSYIEGELGAGAHRAWHRQSSARDRRDGLPRDHGPPRAARRRAPRALRPALGDGPGDDGGRATSAPIGPGARRAQLWAGVASRRPWAAHRGAPRPSGAPGPGGCRRRRRPRATMPATRPLARGGRRA